MKHLTFIVILLSLSTLSKSQTTITQLSPLAIKTHWVIPVKIESSTDLFYFEGYAGQKPGCFGIEPNLVNQEGCDQFTFEPAGMLPGTTVPLYFIKRTDGKLLSYQLGGAAFVDRMSRDNLKYQTFVVTKILSTTNPNYTNGYAFILPLVPAQYGYTLKIYDNYSAVGYSADARIKPAESEFYLARKLKNQAVPNTNLINPGSDKQDFYQVNDVNGKSISLSQLSDQEYQFTSLDGSILRFTVKGKKITKAMFTTTEGVEIPVTVNPSTAKKEGKICVKRNDNNGDSGRGNGMTLDICHDPDAINKALTQSKE